MQEYNRYRKEANNLSISKKEYSGKVAWQSPSNIALIKYWGKRDGQLPMNPSLSFTLSNAKTSTRVYYNYDGKRGGLELSFLLDNRKNEQFSERIRHYLMSLVDFFPFISSLHLEIHSGNTFPHSSGIASSASAFSALALCLVEIEYQLLENEIEEKDFLRKASFIARLGSGSASRSIYGGLVEWGASSAIKDSSDEYAIPYSEKVNFIFSDYCDTILLIDSGEKKVSSSAGHERMHRNPYADIRFEEAGKNMAKLLAAMREADLLSFIQIVEFEALSLHALLLTSFPGYILLKPNSLEAIQRIRDYRRSNNIPVGFTIDAGANIHIIYPGKEKQKVEGYIQSNLVDLCSGQKFLIDGVGTGPKRLNL